jgi:hypothetical protein
MFSAIKFLALASLMYTPFIFISPKENKEKVLSVENICTKHINVMHMPAVGLCYPSFCVFIPIE